MSEYEPGDIIEVSVEGGVLRAEFLKEHSLSGYALRTKLTQSGCGFRAGDEIYVHSSQVEKAV